MQYLKQDGGSPLIFRKPTGGQLSLEWCCPVGDLDSALSALRFWHGSQGCLKVAAGAPAILPGTRGRVGRINPNSEKHAPQSCKSHLSEFRVVVTAS